MNTINLEALKTYHGQLEKVLSARNGTRGEHTQLLLDAVNLGVEVAYIAASSALSVALDVRAIRAAVEGRGGFRLTGLSNKSEPPG